MYAASTPVSVDYGLRWSCDVIEQDSGAVTDTCYSTSREAVLKAARDLARSMSVSLQPTLFDGPDAQNRKARDWIVANPTIWHEMLGWARSDAESGTRISMKAYAERARAMRPLCVHGFGLDNRITAPLARYVAQAVPEAAPLMSMRRSKSDVVELPGLPVWLAR